MLPGPIRVMLVDDHQMVLEALKTLIELHTDIEIVGTASTAQAGAQMLLDTQPDVAIFDIDFPGVDAFDVLANFTDKNLKTRIIFLSAHLSDVFVHQAISVSASGYILKEEPHTAITDAIRKVHAGQFVFSPRVQEKLVYDSKRNTYEVQTESRLCELSLQQLSILRHLAHGESVKQIALALDRSEKSIDSHKYRIMNKLGIHDRVELARYAIREGLALI